MKRLTECDEYGNADIIGVDSEELQLNLEFDEFNKVTDALNRLASYEDTGLTPKEVARLKAERDKAVADLTGDLKGLYDNDICELCKHRYRQDDNVPCDDCVYGCGDGDDELWQWRGLEEENKNENNI